ncbi:MAG: WD40 repeat domain-containing protein [Planctomycetales bacterium]
MIARFSALKATVAAFTILGALGARPDEPAIPERTDLRVIARLSEERFAGSPGHILAFSPDGKLLAEATFGIGIWDVSTGKRVVKLNGHWAGGLSLTRRGVSAIAFSNDGQTLYSTGGDGAIRVWEVTTGMLLKEILVPWLWVDANLNWSHGLVPLYGLSVTSDAKRLATTAHGGSVHVWNLETGELDWSLGKNVAEKIDPAKFGPIELKNIQEVWKLPLDPRVPHPRPLFSPDGNSLVLALNDGVQAWNVKDRTQKFKTTTGGAVRYSPDGLSLVTVRSDDITIWDAQTGERTGGFVSELPMTAPLRFLPDGRLVTGIDEGNGIRICKFPAGRPAKSFAHGRESPRGMAVSPDGGLLAAAFDGSRLQLWDIRTGKLQNDGGHSAPVNALRFSPDGRFLISGSSDCSLRVWETNEWTQ